MQPTNPASMVLEVGPPERLDPFSAAAIFVYGAAAGRPELRLGEQPLHPTIARRRSDSRVRWWHLLRIPALEPGATITLTDRAGDRLAAVTAAQTPAPGTRGEARGRRIAVCMTTFRPSEPLFRTQVDSIRAQDTDDWHCVIVDDASGPESGEMIERVIGDDARFTVHNMDTRLGFYGNFERALRLVPADAELVALADHDDRWHADKLRTLADAIGDSSLVYSDMRLTGEEGHVFRETLWHGRRNNFTDLSSMLVANTVTGAAAMFRRSLLEIALPFPGPLGVQFHDHWLACCALAAGQLAYVDRPLYDYVQHPGAVFGEVSGGTRGRRRAGASRAGYFYGYLGRAQFAATLLDRLGVGLAPEKRRELELFVSAEHSPAAMALMSARAIRHRVLPSSTLGTEGDLVAGLLWRAAAVAGLARDVSLPDPLAAQQQRLRRWRSAL